MFNHSSRVAAILQALFVTFLWSTSWVLIKIGLEEIPALTFAGLRYFLAFLCLLPFAIRGSRRVTLTQLSRRDWLRLMLLGLLMYAVTQGAQFLGLVYLPAITASLLLSVTPVVVAVLGIPLLKERPTGLQWIGVGLFLLGAGVYFYPVSLPAAQLLGIIIIMIGVFGNAGASLLGRSVNRAGDIPALTVTVVSMGVGSILLLVAGILVQGLPALGVQSWLIIAWLAVVNTAFAFTLWNHTLRTLPAMESSIINNTMLIQIAVLAWVFLGERLTLQEVAGLGVAAVGALLVQLRRARMKQHAEASAPVPAEQHVTHP